MNTRPYDVAVIGGGIVGVATAMNLLANPGRRVLVLEAEGELAAHQTGHNSGVIHSGLYYKPGSLKAATCTRGREALYRFCEEEGVAHERCGKVVVATTPTEVTALDELERRGRASGLDGLKRLVSEEIREREPHVVGLDGLFVPQTGIVDYAEVTRALARRITERGGEIRLNTRFLGRHRDGAAEVIETDRGEFTARNLINCAGLNSDRVALACGVDPGLRIVPFRGEYHHLSTTDTLINHLVYPVPDPRFPFLGVHFTRMIGGGIEAGPNAVLAFKRHGYSKLSFSLRDTISYLTYGGFWRMAWRHWRMGLAEMWRSLSRRAFVRALNKLVPELTVADLRPGGAGVRAQALLPDGTLADDFQVTTAPRMIHVLNAPSPAATAALAVGRHVADLAEQNFDSLRHH